MEPHSGVLVGFVGQGYIGKNYADDFVRRRFEVVRYALEPEYSGNKEQIKDCDVVFIAVPTPTTPEGFDARTVEEGLSLVGEGKVAVIKSTILPGSTARFQEAYPQITIVYSPEFLCVSTAAEDAAHPFSNIIGVAADTEEHRAAADLLHRILPKAPFSQTITSTEAELIKYSHNVNGYLQVLTFNLLHDMAERLGARWEVLQDAFRADPMISNQYINPVHKNGRGAGGACFIKDFAAFAALYREYMPESEGAHLLDAAEEKNIELLVRSNKDPHLLEQVYGAERVREVKESL